MSDPRRTIREQTRLIYLWRVLTVVTTVAAVIFPDSPLLMAWVIFMSAYAIVISHEAVKAGAEPSVEAS